MRCRLVLLVLLLGVIGRSARGAGGPLERVLQPYVDRHSIAGAVALAASATTVLHLEAVGYADLQQRRRMQPGDLFWIASMTKPMTAAAIFVLVDEGKLHVDDPVSKYLPEFATHPEVRIRHLLNHTSGLPTNIRMQTDAADRLPLAERIPYYAAARLIFPPGTRYLYSNCGYNALGRIVEVASGMPYARFMQRHLLDPLQMRETTFCPTREQQRHLARVYRWTPHGLQEIPIAPLSYPLEDPSRQAMPAAGLFSTAIDVTHFAQMLLQGGVFDGRRVLSEDAVRQLTMRQTPATVAEDYGFGFARWAGKFGHGGMYGTTFSVDPERQRIHLVLVQIADEPARDHLLEAVEAACP